MVREAESDETSMPNRRKRLAIIKDFSMKRREDKWVVGWDALKDVEDIDEIRATVELLVEQEMPMVWLVLGDSVHCMY